MTDAPEGAPEGSNVRHSGPFGAGGTRMRRVRVAFFGRLGSEFVAFAEDRVHRLDLRASIVEVGERVEIEVEGPEAMLGAFEMACCVGPDRCLVEEWTVIEEAELAP